MASRLPRAALRAGCGAGDGKRDRFAPVRVATFNILHGQPVLGARPIAGRLPPPDPGQLAAAAAEFRRGRVGHAGGRRAPAPDPGRSTRRRWLPPPWGWQRRRRADVRAVGAGTPGIARLSNRPMRTCGARCSTAPSRRTDRSTGVPAHPDAGAQLASGGLPAPSVSLPLLVPRYLARAWCRCRTSRAARPRRCWTCQVVRSPWPLRTCRSFPA